MPSGELTEVDKWLSNPIDSSAAITTGSTDFQPRESNWSNHHDDTHYYHYYYRFVRVEAR